MTSSTTRGGRRGLWLLAPGAIVSALAAPAPAAAQATPGAVMQPLGPGSGAELRRHLNTLAENPRSLSALVGAGRAALAAGDAQAALSFFGRADEISPRDPRVKAGMASALVQLEQPQAALRLFDEAASLGAPTDEIAGDRGLAHDMLGDPRRAQQDYTLALRHRDDPEVRRRMALSLAISGQRDAALRMIEDQLRRHDRAARRTQTFVLALTGDAAGANRVAQSAMPPGAAQAMAPFLTRLAGLSPGQKAMAVHFGHFPSDGRAMASSADTRPHPDALALAGVTPPAAQSLGQPQSQPQRQPARTAQRTTRRRPDITEEIVERIGPGSRAPLPNRRPEREAAASQPRQPVQVAQLEARRAAPPVAQPAQQQPRREPQEPAQTRFQGTPAPAGSISVSQTVQQQPTPISGVPISSAPQESTVVPPTVSDTSVSASPPPVQEPAASPPAATSTTTLSPSREPVQRPPTIATTSVPPSQEPAQPPIQQPVAQPAEASNPGFTLTPQDPQPSAAAPARAEPAPRAANPVALADIASVVNSLSEEAAPGPAASPPRRPAAPATLSQRPTQTAATATRPRARATQPAHPSRHWVQIAGGADRAALPREFARLRGLAPQQLGNRTPYTTPLRATNRLLVGPFSSFEDAQEFVNALAQRNVAAFAWTSPAGQEIERLLTGR